MWFKISDIVFVVGDNWPSHLGQKREGKLHVFTTLQQQQSLTYNAEKIIGNGSFGVVFKATIAETGETVAIKKVF